MATYYHDFGSMLQDYINQVRRFVPALTPPTQLDPSNLIKGVQPVLQQEERRAQQAAAAQFAKLGIPVSSAYQERLGRIGGETAAKLADITNRYMFEAAKENARLQWEAQLEQYRQMMGMLQGLLPNALAEWQGQSNRGYGTGAYYDGATKLDPVAVCMRDARTIEDYAACQRRYQEALAPKKEQVDPALLLQKATALYQACKRAQAEGKPSGNCELEFQRALSQLGDTR